LIPVEIIDNPIVATDTITFLVNGKSVKQKAAVDYGTIKLYDKEYYYTYIAPGFPISQYSSTKYEILINHKIIKLVTYFDPSNRPKLINGLVIIPATYNYMFINSNYGRIIANDRVLFTRLFKKENKYAYYQANTNNTLIHILDKSNVNTLSLINDNHNTIGISPLFNPGYPLGRIQISTNGVFNGRIRINQQIHNFYNKDLTIDYLPHGRYNISVLDNSDNSVVVDKLNGKDWNKDNFDIDIPYIKPSVKKSSTLAQFAQETQPSPDYANLTINLIPNNIEFKLMGPNYNKQFRSGYQKIKNLIPGRYTLFFNNTLENITVIKNTNNYFSNIN
jgi:hypothetical protein